MSYFSADPQLSSLGPFTSTASLSDAVQLGARFKTQDGRVFRAFKNGAVAAVPGKLYQTAAQITNHQDLVPAAAAIGATQVTVTLGATAATANQYAGGQLMVSITPGQGYSYEIDSHPAADASATLVLTLKDPIQIALTTASNVDLVPNPYNGVILTVVTTITGCPVGVPVYAVAANEYGYLQTGGIANVLADGTVLVGDSVVYSNGTAGAVEAAANASTEAQSVVGRALSGIATTEYGPIFLTLDC